MVPIVGKKVDLNVSHDFVLSQIGLGKGALGGNYRTP